MTACSKEGATEWTELASRLPDTGGMSTALAYCNQASTANFVMKLQAYVDGTTNQVNMNYAVVKLTAVPAAFSSGTSHIALWKWLANTSNQVTFDQTALLMYAYDSQTGTSITGWKNTLRWSDLSAKYTEWGSTSVAAFLARVNIIVNLKDPNGEYDVLELAHYTTSTGALIGQVDALLPIFAANPNDYATDSSGGNRAARLKALHPFASQASQNLTSAQYQTMSQNYCF
ncbi:hypothetical protein D3C72_1627180 [compost metagenome]